MTGRRAQNRGTEANPGSVQAETLTQEDIQRARRGLTDEVGEPMTQPRGTVLVVAGSYRQFEVWRSRQPREIVLQAKYLYGPSDVAGWGPDGVSEIVAYGQWWLSEIYKDPASWERLMLIQEEVEYRRTGHRTRVLHYGELGGEPDSNTVEEGVAQIQLNSRSPALKARWVSDRKQRTTPGRISKGLHSHSYRWRVDND